jgi:hypothetical protein
MKRLRSKKNVNRISVFDDKAANLSHLESLTDTERQISITSD